jgi:hypothetical protein
MLQGGRIAHPDDASTIQVQNIYESGCNSVNHLCMHARHKPDIVGYNPTRPFESADPSKNKGHHSLIAEDKAHE